MSIRSTNFVRRLRGLDITERAVAFTLADHAAHPSGEICVGMQTIAEESSLANRQTASDVVGRLRELGVITTAQVSKGGRGNPTLYYMNFSLTGADPSITLAPINRNPRVAVNRNPGVAVSPEQTATQPPGNCNPDTVENAETATQNDLNCNPPVAGRGFKGNARKGKAGEGSPNGSLAAAAVAMGDKIETAFKSLNKIDEPFGSLAFKIEFTRVFFEFRPRENILHNSFPDLLEAVIHSCQLKGIKIPAPFYFEKKFAECYRDLGSDYIFRPAQTREVRDPDD